MAVARPMPELAPVTTLTVMVRTSVDSLVPGHQRVHSRAGVSEPSRGGFLQDVHAAGGAEADDVGQADFGVLDLPFLGLAAKVEANLPDVGDAGGRDRVTLRLQPAGHVDRTLPVPPRGAGVEEVDC